MQAVAQRNVVASRVSSRPSPASRRSVYVCASAGYGKGRGNNSGNQGQSKEEMFEIQQDILNERRKGMGQIINKQSNYIAKDRGDAAERTSRGQISSAAAQADINKGRNPGKASLISSKERYAASKGASGLPGDKQVRKASSSGGVGGNIKGAVREASSGGNPLGFLKNIFSSNK